MGGGMPAALIALVNYSPDGIPKICIAIRITLLPKRIQRATIRSRMGPLAPIKVVSHLSPFEIIRSA
jgi:hypothetical protein